jgi:hypothetical protein
MVYFSNSQPIYFLSELTFCTTILVHHVLLCMVVPQESPARDGWDLFKWAPTSRLRLITFCYTWWYRMEVMRGMDGTYSKGNPPSRMCLAMFCHTWMFRILYMRGKGPLHSKRSVSDVGRCPRRYEWRPLLHREPRRSLSAKKLPSPRAGEQALVEEGSFAES